MITIRLDPRLKYLAELAARRQRRPLSSYVEWAIEESLKSVNPSSDNTAYENEYNFFDAASSLWDVDEADRFAKLALRYPALLTHEEQILWKLIRECGLLWRGRFDDDEWRWRVHEGSLIMERLREHWQTFLDVANGSAPDTDLPTWQRSDPKSNLDDDIPF